MSSSRLRRILIAYSVNRLGDWFGFVALSIAVYENTHSALAVSALFVSAQVVPALVVPAVVARVEASSRRSELSGLYFFEGVATALLAVLVWNFSLPAILVVAALDGTAGLAASALLRAAAARAAREEVEARVSPERREEPAFAAEVQVAEGKANSAINIVFSAAFMLGPAIAGVVVAVAGAPTGLLIDAALFAVTATLLLDLRPNVEEAGGESVRARLMRAWRHINEVPAMRALLGLESLALVFFAAGGPIEIVFAKSTLSAGSRGYGFLLAAWGVGAVMGSLVFARSVQRSVAAMLTVGTLLVGLAYVGFSVAPTLLAACGAAVVGGVGNGVAVGVADRQRAVPHPAVAAGPDDGRGRIDRCALPRGRPAAGRRAGHPVGLTRRVPRHRAGCDRDHAGLPEHHDRRPAPAAGGVRPERAAAARLAAAPGRRAGAPGRAHRHALVGPAGEIAR